jgi:hypothetical protein
VVRYRLGEHVDLDVKQGVAVEGQRVRHQGSLPAAVDFRRLMQARRMGAVIS